jgi:hypothetical protein
MVDLQHLREARAFLASAIQRLQAGVRQSPGGTAGVEAIIAALVEQHRRIGLVIEPAGA